MKLRSVGPLAMLTLLSASSGCGKRQPVGMDGAAGGSGQLDASDAGGTDTAGPSDGPRDTPAADTPADTGRDTPADAPRDVAADAPTTTDVPVDGGPGTDGAADRSSADGPCGSPDDPRNCGACGNDCTALSRVRADRVECRAGTCFVPENGCQPGWGNCSGDPTRGCTSDISQPTRCGCGVTCPISSTRLCATPADGPPVCVAACSVVGLTMCGQQQCVDLKTNSNHCGACDNRCSLANALSACVAGKCAVSQCTPGYAACDPTFPGCDTILGSFYNCRGCGQSCAAAHADGRCGGASGCARACHAGWGDCDTSSTDCETPLDTAANCGGCGTACPTDRPLCGGPRGQEICRAACAAPAADACGTSCTDLQSDPRHCGACGTVCESYQACERGRCTPRYVKSDVMTSVEGGVQLAFPVIAPDGAYFVNGYFSQAVDFNPGAGQDVRTPSTNYDTFVSKFEADGSYAWTRSWANVYTAVTAVAPDGSVIVTGSFNGAVDFDPGAGVTRLTAQGESDAVVLKLSASGSLVWARAFTMTTEDAASSQNNDAWVGADGSVYVVGSYRGQVDLDPGSATDLHRTASNDEFDVHVVKLNAAGNLVWARTFGGSMEDGAAVIAADSAGLLWIGGTYTGTADLDPGAGVDAHTAGGQDGYVVRLDMDGNFRDSRVYGFDVYDSVDSISFDSDGSIYIGGSSSDGIRTSIGFIQRLSQAGSEVWLKRRDGMYWPVAAPGGGVLFSGGQRESETGLPILSAGKLDRDGNAVWGIPAPAYRRFYYFALTADATKIVIAGGTEGGSFDLDPGAGSDVVTAVGGIITRFAF